MMNALAPLRLHTRTRGFSLIEMLVALLVLSFGLLGLAGLQAQGLQHNHSAYLRSQATFLAYEIIDSMRANRAAAANGAYETSFGTEAGGGTSVAAQDLANWKAALATTLPGGDGRIAVTQEGLRVAATVRVEWNERVRSPADPGEPTQTMGFSWDTEL